MRGKFDFPLNFCYNKYIKSKGERNGATCLNKRNETE